MNTFFITVGMVLFAMMIIVLYRVVFGPSMIDRMVAANLLGTKTTVLLVVIGTLFSSQGGGSRVDMFIDFALTYALLNFIGSIAASKYFYKMKHIEPEEDASELKEAGK